SEALPTGDAIKIGPPQLHLPHYGLQRAADDRPGRHWAATLGAGRTALRLLGTIALLHQHLGQASGQLLAYLPYCPGNLLQGGFGLFHLRLQGVQPPIKALMQVLPKLGPLFLLAPLSQRDDCRSHGWLLSLPERAPHRWGPAANGLKSLA